MSVTLYRLVPLYIKTYRRHAGNMTEAVCEGWACWETHTLTYSYRRFTPSPPTHTHTLAVWWMWCMLTSDCSPQEHCGYQNSHRIRKERFLQEITLKYNGLLHTPAERGGACARVCVCVCQVTWDQIRAETLSMCHDVSWSSCTCSVLTTRSD